MNIAQTYISLGCIKLWYFIFIISLFINWNNEKDEITLTDYLVTLNYS